MHQSNEIACIREATRITELATKAVMAELKPGKTELELVGVAQKCIYENGAEYEGLPMYCFAEKSTRHAISRSSYKVIQEGDIVQLNLSAKICGYSPSIGLPVCCGKLSPEKRELVQFGLDAHYWTEEHLKPGVLASDVAKGFIEFYEKNGKRGEEIDVSAEGATTRVLVIPTNEELMIAMDTAAIVKA